MSADEGNPFEAPSEARPATLGPADLDDIGPVQPHFTATAGGFALMVAGLTSAVAAAQVYMAVTVHTWAWFLPPLFGLLGLASIPVGGSITRASFNAAVGGTALAAMLTAVELVWTFHAVTHGFVAPLQALAFLVSLLSLLIVPFSIKTNRDVEAARAKLLA